MSTLDTRKPQGVKRQRPSAVFSVQPWGWSSSSRASMGCLLEEYPNAATGSVQTVVYFDKKWNYCPAGDAAFCMKITPTNTEDASLLHFYFEVLHMNGSKDDIYSMDLELHVPNQP